MEALIFNSSPAAWLSFFIDAFTSTLYEDEWSDAGGFISPETQQCGICAPIQPLALMYFYIKRHVLD